MQQCIKGSLILIWYVVLFQEDVQSILTPLREKLSLLLAAKLSFDLTAQHIKVQMTVLKGILQLSNATILSTLSWLYHFQQNWAQCTENNITEEYGRPRQQNNAVREEEEDKSEMMIEKISRLWDSVAFWNNQIYYGAIIGFGCIISEGRSNFLHVFSAFSWLAFSSHL